MATMPPRLRVLMADITDPSEISHSLLSLIGLENPLHGAAGIYCQSEVGMQSKIYRQLGFYQLSLLKAS